MASGRRARWYRHADSERVRDARLGLRFRLKLVRKFGNRNGYDASCDAYSSTMFSTVTRSFLQHFVRYAHHTHLRTKLMRRARPFSGRHGAALLDECLLLDRWRLGEVIQLLTLLPMATSDTRRDACGDKGRALLGAGAIDRADATRRARVRVHGSLELLVHIDSAHAAHKQELRVGGPSTRELQLRCHCRLLPLTRATATRPRSPHARRGCVRHPPPMRTHLSPACSRCHSSAHLAVPASFSVPRARARALVRIFPFI